MRSIGKRTSPVAGALISERPKRAKRSRLSEQLGSASVTYVRKQPNALLHSTEVFVDILAYCDRSTTLDSIVVVSRKVNVIANRLPNLRRVDYIVLEHAQNRSRFDVDADGKSTEERTHNGAFEALIEFANFSVIGRLCLKVGNKKNSVKFSHELWERFANIVAKCDILDIEGVDFSNVHADMLAKLIRCLRPSTANFAGCLLGTSPCVDNALRHCGQDMTTFIVRPRDGARHPVYMSDEGILRYLFERQQPAAAITLRIECAKVTKTFVRSLIDRAITVGHDFTLYIDRVHPDEQEGLEPFAEYVEDHRLTTGQNAVYGDWPSGLNFLFYLEKGDFWSLRIGTTAQSYLQAAA